MLLNLNDLNTLKEPSRSWRWRAMLPDLSGIGLVNNLVVEQVSFPHDLIAVTNREIGSEYLHFPSVKDVSTMSLTLYEDESFYTTSYLYAWKSRVRDMYGNYGLPSDYKFKTTLFMYGLEDSNTPNLQLDLEGVWPTQIHSFDLNYTDSGFFTVGCDFSIDSVTFVGSNAYSIGTGGITSLNSLINSVIGNVQGVARSALSTLEGMANSSINDLSNLF